MPTLCLKPPYYNAFSAPGSDRPLGSILMCDLQEGLATFAAAIEWQRTAPWCPLVLRIADPRVTAGVLGTFEPRPGCFAQLLPGDAGAIPTAGRALAAVRRRPIPTAETIAAYVEARLGESVAPLLVACIAGGGVGSHPARTLTRRVRQLGAFEVRDWRGLARLVRAAALAAPRPACSLEVAAWDAGSDPRSLRRWMRAFLGLDWDDVRLRAGWEWMLELALRQGGYVQVPEGVVERKAS